MHEIMAGRKKKLRYSEETLWFPEWLELHEYRIFHDEFNLDEWNNSWTKKKLRYSEETVISRILQWLEQCMSISFGCKNRICHHEFKLDAWNNGWTKKEAKIIRRNCDFPNITMAGAVHEYLLWLQKYSTYVIMNSN